LKNVLILCDLFPPAFGPRMGYLCKYLKRYGWNPTVVTEWVPDTTFAFLTDGADVRRVRFYRTQKGLLRRLEWMLVFVCNLLWDYKNRCLYRAALRCTRERTYDLLLCSTFRTFPLPAALKVARKARLPLVVDLRDILEQSAGNESIAHSLPRLGGIERWLMQRFKLESLRRRNRVLGEARHITTVSPWHVTVLKAFNPNVSLIYNGYDPALFFPAPVAAPQFYITYTGRLFSTAMHNPELLFQAVTQLAAEQVITPDRFRIRWFADPKSQQIIRESARPYPIFDFMDFPGYIPASEVPVVLNESALLLILTNKAGSQSSNGIMTTKFFEALAVEKPILCVRGDEGCLEEAIRRTQSGLSAHHAAEVYCFIRDHYLHWQATGRTVVHVNHAEVRAFSREAQAGQFARLFDQILSL
jgi:hypothetical protein